MLSDEERERRRAHWADKEARELDHLDNLERLAFTAISEQTQSAASQALLNRVAGVPGQSGADRGAAEVVIRGGLPDDG